VQVLTATRPPPKSEQTLEAETSVLDSLIIPDGVAPAWSHTLPYPDVPSFPTEQNGTSCQKLLFSATLTRDPGKIAALELQNPKYFVVQGSKDGALESRVLDVVMEKFSVPSTLMAGDA